LHQNRFPGHSLCYIDNIAFVVESAILVAAIVVVVAVDYYYSSFLNLLYMVPLMMALMRLLVESRLIECIDCNDNRSYKTTKKGIFSCKLIMV
jgi:hypothetical protein